MSRVLMMLVAVAAWVGTARAQEAEEELRPHRRGPATIDLGDGVELELPEGMILLERAEAHAELVALGEDPSGILAMVWADGEALDWTLFIALNDIGHVSDADAGQLDAGELLEVLRRSNDAQNPKRLAAGSLELHVDGWSRPPAYDPAGRVLSWAIEMHHREGKLLNDFTNVLGRRGYVSLILAAPPEDMAASREQAAAVMASVRYQPGHRYQDFDPSVDKSSGLGLRELVVGGGVLAAVKAGKAGLIAKILIVFKKLFVFIGLAIYGVYKWLKARALGRREEEAA